MALATFECSAATCGEGLHDGQLRDHPVIIESSGAVLLQRDSPPITELCVHVPVNIVQEKTWNYKPNPLPPAQAFLHMQTGEGGGASQSWRDWLLHWIFP